MSKTKHLWFYGYQFSITIFNAVVWGFALFNYKAALRIKGLKNWKQELRKKVGFLNEDKKRIWFHCASLGEFELAFPLISKIKAKREYFVIVSFFSSSGYEERKSHPDIDLVIYLPPDGKSNARYFLKILQPDRVVFVKYDFWLNYMYQIFRTGIPLSVIGCRFNEKSAFFNEFKRLYQPAFTKVNQWFCQDKKTSEFLKSKGFKGVFHFGDTRIDRTRAIAKEEKKYPGVAAWQSGGKTIAFGSIWPDDWEVLSKAPALSEGELKLLIAPHEISELFIKQIEKDFPGACLRYSQIDNVNNPGAFRILIVDNVGHLSQLYRYADMAYVGGAFGAGLHNIYEPLAYKIPVIFGPKTLFYPEADDAVNAGVGKQIDSTESFQYAYNYFEQIDQAKLKKTIEDFLSPSYEASSRILNEMGL